MWKEGLHCTVQFLLLYELRTSALSTQQTQHACGKQKGVAPDCHVNEAHDMRDAVTAVDCCTTLLHYTHTNIETT